MHVGGLSVFAGEGSIKNKRMYQHFCKFLYTKAKTKYKQAKTKYTQLQPSTIKNNQVKPRSNQAETEQEPSTTKYNQVQPSKTKSKTKQ